MLKRWKTDKMSQNELLASVSAKQLTKGELYGDA